MNPRTIAIGDIHGCSAALDALLEAIQPRPEDTHRHPGRLHQPGTRQPGRHRQADRIDRPLPSDPDSWGITTRCSSKPGPAITQRPGSAWAAIATLDSYGPGRDLDSSLRRTSSSSKAASITIETDTHIFVHASYIPDIPMDEQHAHDACGGSHYGR